jgi:hypothetical protein
VFAALAMLVAAFVEISRKKNAPADVTYIDATPADLANVSPCQNIYKKHGKKVEIFNQPFDISAFLHDTYMMDLQKVGSEQCVYNEQSVHNKPFFFDREPNPCISENATSLFYSPVFDHSDSEKIPQLEQISKTDKKMSYKDYRLMNNK